MVHLPIGLSTTESQTTELCPRSIYRSDCQQLNPRRKKCPRSIYRSDYQQPNPRRQKCPRSTDRSDCQQLNPRRQNSVHGPLTRYCSVSIVRKIVYVGKARNYTIFGETSLTAPTSRPGGPVGHTVNTCNKLPPSLPPSPTPVSRDQNRNTKQRKLEAQVGTCCC